MKYFKYIILILIFTNTVNAQDIKVDFSHSHMFGIGVEKVQFDNIILGLPVYVQTDVDQSSEMQQPTPEEATEEISVRTSLVYDEVPYNTSMKICRYNSGRLYLLPQLTLEEPNCTVAEGVDLSSSYGISLTSDIVLINNIFYNEIFHNIIFKFNFEKLQFEQDDETIILPTLAPNYIRIILDWNRELPELDAHLTGPIAPYSFERFHLYFDAISDNGDVATLDVGYDEFENKPEIVTILPPIIDFETQQRDTSLRPGLYRFTVQHFYGNGTLLDSNAIVRLQIGNEPNEHLFILPNYEGLELLGEMDIWIVFEIEILEDRTVIINPIQSYELGISPHEIR
ncbi:hypothetical protein QUF74_14005 [Candidatus Halobeggiatoa sp. HSG11]|nr:hypothetical protein [Candidatus Halobeggiatoa sp. HSG11]